mmetsp:Transcript_9118/g.9175  ORF Transcript_9118/g.9175 Transcript_9118/m.9175 type:complete len:1301 (+) Transcript_9118:45-3947(+)
MSASPLLDDSPDVALSFKHVSVSVVAPPKLILSNVSGYIKKGGITAVLGASASGKSLLMQALASRVQNLSIGGEILIGGLPVDPTDIHNAVGYVPQDDMLIGELSAREMITNAALLKRNKTRSAIDDDVNRLLDAFGLTKVADNAIGTVFVRGLSGGQKKRVDVGTELIAAPGVLMLDEPTSGLDASIALEVLTSVKEIVQASDGKLSVMLSIHQPNSRILDLFDHIMLLGGGGMLFFGTVPQSIEYFTSIGFRPPENYTPTDFFLQVSDTTFGTRQDFDFEGSFSCSDICSTMMNHLDAVQRKGARSYHVNEDGDIETPSGRVVDSVGLKSFSDNSAGETSFWRQYSTLIARDVTLAIRDPALYYLQFALVCLYGFLVGATFLKLKYEINQSMSNVTGGILWLTMMMCYVQVFKVYHLSRGNRRFKHERANNTYGVLAHFWAELTVTMIVLTLFIPGCAIGYFMMGFPEDAYGFTLFTLWVTSLAAESMLNFITKFHEDATVSIVASQCVLVVLTVFGGGVFIPWDETPHYWFWLQEMSIFTQASRTAIVNVLDHIDYKCVLRNGACIGPSGNQFPCDASPSDGYSCYVKGRSVLYVLQGTSYSEDKWTPFGWLVLIFVCFRGGVLLFDYYPVDRMIFALKQWWSAGITKRLLEALVSVRRIESQLVSFISETHKEATMMRASLRRQASTNQHDVNKSSRYDEMFTMDGTFVPEPGFKNRKNFTLVWENLTLLLKKKGTKLIDNVSGMARSGRVLALMGPSGAGKTTMLNALGNRAPYADVSGKITFGKREFVSSDLFFVPQFDEVNENLTVFEQIELIGLLKCRGRVAMHRRLHHLLHILGLHQKSKMSCARLTGGELKRVSVGMGMICNPSVLFLDEPTTGLDSTAAFSIVQHLVELAESTNVTVIMTIHQPAEMVFDMLQDLYLLEGGRLAYFGPLPAARPYFLSLGYECPVNNSLADFCLDLIYQPPKDTSTTWKELYSSSPFSMNMVKLQNAVDTASMAAPAADAPPNEMVRMYEMIVFFVKYYSREIGFYYLRVVFLVLVAFFIGTMFLLLTPETEFLVKYSGAIFFNMWTALFSAISCTALLSRDRRQALEQIKNAAINPGVYCLSQFITSLPFNFLASLIFNCIFHWVTNVNPTGEAFIYSILLTEGHILLMEALMLCVVQVLGDAMLSTTFSMVLLGTLFLYAGFFIQVKDMPLWIGWVCFMIPTKYSYDGYLYMIFHSQTFDVSFSNGLKMSGDEVLWQIYGQKDVQPWPMFLVLMAFVVLIRLFHYGILYFQTYEFLPKQNKRSQVNV